MKIWYLTSEFPPDFGGGISMYIEQVAFMFAKQNHEVTVIVRDSNSYTMEYPKNNLRIIRFQHMIGAQYQWLGYWAALAYQYAEETLDLIDKEGKAPDIIEVQDYNAIGYYLLQRKYLKDKRLDNTKIIVHLHTPTFELARINQLPRYEFPTYWIGQMEKFCINAADSVVTQSQFLKGQIQTYAPQQDITVIPLPYVVDEPVWNPNENHTTDILYLGRSEYRKGVVQLITEMEKLWLQGHNYKLTLLGGDTYFHPRGVKLGEWLKKKYERWIKGEKLIFKSTVPPHQLNNEIKSARIAIIPSLYENYPYNCIIAMSAGIPVIVSQSGGQSEMVENHGENGYIFDWDKKDDFQIKILDLLKMENKELQVLGQNGYNQINRLCNLNNNYNNRLTFYNQVMEKTKDKIYPVSQSIPKKSPKTKIIDSKKGLLSIIIPYYNLADYIEETLESALKISYSNFEIIIVNDGSNDEKSIDILNQIKNRKNSVVRIVDIENAGLANARNIGAEHALGEFIAFLDADDLVDPDFYTKAVDLLETYSNISFVYSWVEFFGARTGIWPTFNTEFPYLLGMNMLTAFVVVRREDFLNFGRNRIIMEYGLEDFEGWVTMCENGYSGISIPEALVQYRVRPESMSRQFNRDMVTYLLDQLSSHHPKLYEKFGLEIYNLLVANGPGYLWNNPTFDHPSVEYSTGQAHIGPVQSEHAVKYELMRMANSKWGNRLIKTFFKMKLNRVFK
ncbi:glycosyltransferase [Paenibacillus hexagrammi]|uniref:Glycosyltransferase n=1 Tax=Paenibacillus hexagrammi TaxID=2908839 RepID=A0ABY3SJN9_9BACL|nr:glycosyltransferase [Paenibacillus sp. YPD9-1]UJF34267.1 glycosyltransferase [Paenibacillus sp. YPD9-1]